jgi:hypothetical protein
MVLRQLEINDDESTSSSLDSLVCQQWNVHCHGLAVFQWHLHSQCNNSTNTGPIDARTAVALCSNATFRREAIIRTQHSNAVLPFVWRRREPIERNAFVVNERDNQTQRYLPSGPERTQHSNKLVSVIVHCHALLLLSLSFVFVMLCYCGRRILLVGVPKLLRSAS